MTTEHPTLTRPPMRGDTERLSTLLGWDLSNCWLLARSADCGEPTTPTTPGAEWLRNLADSIAEACTWGADEDGMTDPRSLGEYLEDDRRHEIGDGSIPVYTGERWEVFADVSAYQEDPAEIGADTSDMTMLAGACIYQIAERLVGAIADEIRDLEDDSPEWRTFLGIPEDTDTD